MKARAALLALRARHEALGRVLTMNKAAVCRAAPQ